MALSITVAEAAMMNSIANKSRTALTEGTNGAEILPGVVTATLFDNAPDNAALNGTKLNVIGLLQVLEDGVIFKSPNGTYYRLTVSNAGAAVFTAI